LKAAAAEKSRLSAKDVFVAIKGGGEDVKLSPQAKQIMAALEGGSLTRPKLIEKLKTTVTTRQPVERILAYYQKSLIEGGLVRIENPERVAAEDGKQAKLDDKVAKAKAKVAAAATPEPEAEEPEAPEEEAGSDNDGENAE
jgi:hypothetical protein